MLCSRCSLLVCLFCMPGLLVQAQTKQPMETTLRQYPATSQPTNSLAAHHSAEERRKADVALSAGSLQTLPHWQGSYSIEGKRYRYTILGGDPKAGGTTEIKTLIVPVRLTISEFSENGETPLVMDATKIIGQI